MNVISWSISVTAAIAQSQLTSIQKKAASDACDNLMSYAWATKPSVVDGDLQLEVQVDSTNKPFMDSTPYTVRSVTQYVRDIFIKSGLTGLSIEIDDNTGYATVVIRAGEDYTLEDGTLNKGEVAVQAVKPPTAVSAAASGTTAIIKPIVTSTPADVQSADAKQTVSTSVPNTSEFFLEVQVFLEGVQVPHNTCAVSYGINAPPSCTIIIPASSMIRDLPETTKIHVFFKDLLPTSDGIYEWRLLFDGELASLEYTADSEGASMSISGMHSSAYMTLMQLLSLDVASYVFDSNPNLIGNATMAMVLGQNKVNNTIIKNILDAKGYTNMADIVYQLLRSVLTGTADSAVGKFYTSKLGNIAQGWKILKRIYGVSNLAVNSPVVTVKPGTTANNGSTSTPTSDDKTNVAGMNDMISTRYTKGDFVGTDQMKWDGAAGYEGMNKAFLDLFEQLTTAYAQEDIGFEGKIQITSGFRSVSYNNSLGEDASSTSLHLQGRAADISNGNLRISLKRMAEIARKIGFTEVIDTYPTWIHVGLR